MTAHERALLQAARLVLERHNPGDDLEADCFSALLRAVAPYPAAAEVDGDDRPSRLRALLGGIRDEAEASRFGTASRARAALERIRALAVVGLTLVPLEGQLSVSQ